MNIKKINTKYLLISTGVLYLISVITFKKVKKTMLTTAQINFIKYIFPFAENIGKHIGVPPLFLVAQICLETSWGKSSLFTKYYNVGGVKAKKDEPFIMLETTEYINGVKVKKPQPFAKYNSLVDGLTGYANVFKNRYFKKYLNQTTEPNKFAELIQSGPIKYATDINYIYKIKKLIASINQIKQ